jgi:hypothetical protein
MRGGAFQADWPANVLDPFVGAFAGIFKLKDRHPSFRRL